MPNGIRGSDGFAIEVSEPAGRGITVKVRGDLDFATADRLTEALAALPDEHHLDVWVDLHAVGFIDSCGLRALLDARHRFPDRLFVRAGGRARDLLHVTGSERFLTIR